MEEKIRLRKDGRYECRVLTPYGRKSVYDRTEEGVRDKAEKILRDMELGRVIPKSTRVAAYMEKWLKEVKQYSIKRKSYDRLLSIFKCHIEKTNVGRSQIGNIASRDVQKLLNQEAQKYSMSTIKKVKILLNECLTYAEREGHINNNPMKNVTMPSEDNVAVKPKEMTVFTEDDLNKFYKAAWICDENNELVYKYGPAYMLLLNTGLRAGELMALKKADVHIEDEYLFVKVSTGYVKRYDSDHEKKMERIETSPKTKNGIRKVPLNKISKEICMYYIQQDQNKHIDCEYLIHTSNNRPVTHSNFQRGLDRVLNKADLDHAGLHSLRHTFATLLIGSDNMEDMKVDIKAVSEILGHANVGITLKIYYHPEEKKKIDAVRRLELIDSGVSFGSKLKSCV